MIERSAERPKDIAGRALVQRGKKGIADVHPFAAKNEEEFQMRSSIFFLSFKSCANHGPLFASSRSAFSFSTATREHRRKTARAEESQNK